MFRNDHDELSIPDETSLKGSLISYGSGCLFLVLIYIYLIRKKKFGWLFSPKGWVRFSEIFWIKRFDWLNVYETEFVSRCGMDAFLSLRLIHLIMRLLGGFFVLGGVLLLPGYHGFKLSHECVEFCKGHRNMSGVDPYQTCACSTADKFSLANVPQSSNGLWLPVFGIALISLYMLYILRQEYKFVVRLRAMYWLSKPGQMFTVLVDDLPLHLGLDSVNGLRNHFEELFPGKVLSIEPVSFLDESVLDSLKKVGEKRMNAYDDLCRAIALSKKEKPVVYSCCLNSCTMHDIDTLRSRFDRYNRDFAEILQGWRQMEQDEKDGLLNRRIRAAFVTFTSAAAAAIATQSVVHHRFNVVISNASEPADIRWDALGYGAKRRSCSRYWVRICFAILVLFWGVFTVGVSAMTSVSALENQFSFLRDFLEDHEGIKDLIEQSAPLLLTALVAVVNPIICILARVEAHASESDAEQVATSWYFVFLVIQVFLIYGLSGSLLKSINSIVDKPSTLIDMLGSNIPKNANFYIQFFITKYVTSLCLDMFRISDLCTHYLRLCCFGPVLTKRDEKLSRCGCAPIDFPNHRNLSSLNGQHLLLFFIATTYAVIQPLILPAAFLFFIMAYFVYARLFMCVNQQRFDSGGTMWPRSYWLLISALLCGQLTLMGVIGLKNGVGQSTVMFFIFVGTCFGAAMIDFRYRRLCLELPLDITSKVDKKDYQTFKKLENVSLYQYDVLTHEYPNYYGSGLRRAFSFENENEEEEEEENVDDNGQRMYYSYELPVLVEQDILQLPNEYLDDNQRPLLNNADDSQQSLLINN